MKCKRRLYSLRFFILPSLLVPEFFIVDFNYAAAIGIAYRKQCKPAQTPTVVKLPAECAGQDSQAFYTGSK